MTTQPPSEERNPEVGKPKSGKLKLNRAEFKSSDPKSSEAGKREPVSSDLDTSLLPEMVEDMRQQQVRLKLEVEQLHRNLQRLRGLIQTLVSGLIVAIAIAGGISLWFAYRILTQEQLARREAERAATAQAEALEKAEQVEDRVRRLAEKLPEDIEGLQEIIDSQREQLRQLRDRLIRLEVRQRRQEALEAEPPAEEPKEEPATEGTQGR